MIFVFREPDELGFWMKNTHINLDIVYIDAQQRIISTHTMRAYDTKTTPSGGLAKWAIELNEGIVAKLGLKPGDAVQIPAAAQNAP